MNEENKQLSILTEEEEKEYQDRRDDRKNLDEEFKKHVKDIEGVKGYVIVSSKNQESDDPETVMLTTMPSEINNLIALMYSNAITEHEWTIIRVIIDAAYHRIKNKAESGELTAEKDEELKESIKNEEEKEKQ